MGRALEGDLQGGAHWILHSQLTFLCEKTNEIEFTNEQKHTHKKNTTTTTSTTTTINSQQTNQPTTQPINQSTNQPIDQSTNRPIDQSTNRPIDQSTNRPIDQSNQTKPHHTTPHHTTPNQTKPNQTKPQQHHNTTITTKIIQSGEAPFLTGEELPPHSGELKHALSQVSGPTQSQLSRPMSSRHHISMEHRLWRKHLLLNPDTNAGKEKQIKKNIFF